MTSNKNARKEALELIEKAENALRDAKFIDIPSLPIDASESTIRRYVLDVVEQLEDVCSEAFLVALDRAIFERTIQKEKRPEENRVRRLIQEANHK